MQQISCSADSKDLYYLFSSIHASVHHAGGAFCSMGNFKEISSIEQKRRMKLLHLIRLNAVITILFLHYCMPFKLTVNIPAGIHDTDYRHNARILIRNIKH